MSFDTQDEDAFQARREELVEEYAEWLLGAGLPGADAGDANILLDWKWGYRGGELGSWTVPDLHEFLLEWCPRKLSMPPQECGDFPVSVGAFFRFLAARGLLARGSDPPDRLWTFCERSGAKFVQEMSDPANYGMTKSFFAGAGGLDSPLTEDDLERVLARMGPAVAGPALSTQVGPVRLPDPVSRAESAAAAPALDQLGQLHEFCGAPGRPLTQKGNLRLDDARYLVDALGTGDTPDFRIGSRRHTLRSAEDLPVLSWLVQLALDARVVRRHRGRLVAVAGWAELSAVEAVDRLVDAAVDRGLSGFLSPHLTSMAPVRDFVDEGARQLLGELLGGYVDGEPMSIDTLAELVVAHVTWSFGRLNVFGPGLVAEWVRDHFDRLAALGVVTVRDVERTPTEWGGTEATGGSVELTPAGVPVAARLAEEAGIMVITRPDPASATAAALVDAIGDLDPDEWLADMHAWAQRTGHEEAANQITGALNDGEQEAPVVLAVLGKLDELVGDAATRAVKRMLDGPHDGLALNWLVQRGALAPAEVNPERLLRATVDGLASLLDIGPTERAITEMASVSDRDQQTALVERLWCLAHPRSAELLEAIGQHHPDRKIAKAARKSLLRHRSWTASRG